jgi:Protein of unknown function (DUF3060)
VIRFALMLVPALAFADKSFSGGAGGAWDCTTDPVVVITGSNAHYAITGACKSISVAGGHNALTIIKVATLDVTGTGNTITVDSIDAVDINGANNAITYKGGKPKLTQLGQNNRLTPGS